MTKRNRATGRPTYDRQIFAILRAFKGWQIKDIADRASVHPSTVRNLIKGPRRGGTRFPQHWTIIQLMRAAGYTRVEYSKPGDEERVIIDLESKGQ